MKRIDVLPDDVLLEIFDFYVNGQSYGGKSGVEAWQSLIHVCRRWRSLVFRSPRRLNLQLYCSPETPAKDTLDIWPALPLLVWGDMTLSGTDNVIAALGQSNRVSEVFLSYLAGWQLEEVLAVMQVPFPELTDLRLFPDDETLPVIPDSFLGGSAPRLRSFTLDCILFPGLPNLILSTTHLVNLYLHQIPDSGYISPEEMATCLSLLTSLETLSFGSLSSQSLPYRESRRPPPMARSILPELTQFWFKGDSEYLDDLVARIDAPRLDRLSITFFPQTNFDTPHLVRFTSCIPRFQEPSEAHVSLYPDAEVRLIWASDGHGSIGRLCVEISCEESDRQPSSIAQVYTMCLPPLPTVENLRLGLFAETLCSEELDWKDGFENNQWLELLRPFTAVKRLYISEEFRPNLASALQDLVGDRTTEVLPSLQDIFLARFEPFREAIGQFVAARQLSGHPIAVLPL
jgi:hypothetical protein